MEAGQDPNQPAATWRNRTYDEAEEKAAPRGRWWRLFALIFGAFVLLGLMVPLLKSLSG